MWYCTRSLRLSMSKMRSVQQMSTYVDIKEFELDRSKILTINIKISGFLQESI